MKVLTRKEATLLNLIRYFTSKLCSKGHTSERYVSTRQCCECQLLHVRNADPVKKLVRARKYRSENKDTMNAQARARHSIDKDKNNKKSSNWAKANTDKILSKNRRWRKANPDWVNSESSRKRADKLQRIPSWADLKIIRSIYKSAKDMSSTEQKYVVDHYYPLKGETVSGLHVENNLRIITFHENSVKNNRLPINEPECIYD